MKALSLKQPWANLIASGRKTIETRLWGTEYRGTVLIVSSKLPKIEPAGSAVAIAKLIECRAMTLADERAALCEVYEDAVAWIFRDIHPLRPFPVIGQPGLFEVEVPEWRLIPAVAPTFFMNLFDQPPR